MQIVKVRLPAADLAGALAAMREWLDSTRYEPAKFDCGQEGGEVVLSVKFMLDQAAEAFARRFDGEDEPKSFVGDSSPRFAT